MKFYSGVPTLFVDWVFRTIPCVSHAPSTSQPILSFSYGSWFGSSNADSSLCISSYENYGIRLVFSMCDDASRDACCGLSMSRQRVERYR